MGNTFFCERCDIEKFELSRACADQFLTENKENTTADQRWVLKLRCLDDVHSKHRGLTMEAFNELVDKLEKKLKSREVPIYCKNRDYLMECLARNPNCSLNCMKEMSNFIDCVDTLRVKRIKERVHEAQNQSRV